jgi:hypothetical protein
MCGGGLFGRRISGIILAGIAALAGHMTIGEARADCRGGSSARLEVMNLPASYVVDTSLSSLQLGGMVTEWPAAAKSDRTRANGLFVANFMTSRAWRTQGYKRPDGTWCVEATAIRIIYGNTNPETVHVASHIPVGSCGYSAVLFHELKHSQQHRRMVDYGRSWLRNRFNGWSPAAVGTTHDEAKSKLDVILKLQIDAGMAYVRSFYKVNVAQIDTEDEYRRVHKSCTDWPSGR